MIPRYGIADLFAGRPFPERPFVLALRTWDIPETIVGLIRSLPDRCVALGLNQAGGRRMREAAEQAAATRGLRLIWSQLGDGRP